MENIIAIIIILAIVVLAARYIFKAKKRGQKCIGCPDSCHCGKNAGSSCGCNGCGNG